LTQCSVELLFLIHLEYTEAPTHFEYIDAHTHTTLNRPPGPRGTVPLGPIKCQHREMTRSLADATFYAAAAAATTTTTATISTFHGRLSLRYVSVQGPLSNSENV